MTFPTVVSTNSSSTPTVSTSHIVNLPGSLVSGNLILILTNIGTTAATFNALAGWTELLDEGVAGGIAMWYRVSNGAEGATVTFTSSATTRDASISYQISGAINPATQAPQLSTLATGTSANPNATTCTPTGGAKDYLWITMFGQAGEQADDGTLTSVTPTNYGTPIEKTCGVAGSNLGGMIAAASRTNNAASEDATAWTSSDATAWRAYTIAVHPDPNVNASAGGPTGAGAAEQATASAQVLAGSTSATGTAPQPTGHVQALAGFASGAGSAPQPTVTTSSGTSAPAGDALGAGIGEQPEASIGVKPQLSTVIDGGDTSTPPTDIVDAGDGNLNDFIDPEAFCTAVGDAYGSKASVAVNAGVASAAGSAFTAKAAIGALAAAPTAAGTAPQPTVTTGTNDTNAPAGLAAATGTAGAATASIAAQPPTAASTGTAPQPTTRIGAKPNTAEAIGTSSGTTVETGTFANAPAGLAAATGSAFQPTIRIQPNASVGLAAGVANQPAASLGVKAAAPTAAGTAPQPTVAQGALAMAGLASASGVANAPKIDLDINAGLAAAAGQAFPVFGLTGNPLGLPMLVGAVADDDHSLPARDSVGLVAVDDRHSLEV